MQFDFVPLISYQNTWNAFIITNLLINYYIIIMFPSRAVFIIAYQLLK